ncbi:CDP-archaeol synthase [Methylicorpusculum sp.]|uniref:CDP-archaeol synthase n=1 Tax=Methylicorpusculum sp. TaxID=2713644 RepID=UPI0027267F40|nr:CDP-archaeol synthase [Methylicorpusculum sp.]MDO8846570.1 CDP-archaeol synthase [Methylicorpusculum sp.]
MTAPAFHWTSIIHASILLLVANGAPIIAYKLMGKRFAWPVDHGLCLGDRQPVFGRSKTWRGIAFSAGLSGCVAILLGFSFWLGMLFGLLAMSGDLLASFIKRRRGWVESSRARGLDTVPESLLPLWFLRHSMALEWPDITVVMVLFFMIEEFLSPILFRLHIRKRPY